jgi:hypothetical protein
VTRAARRSLTSAIDSASPRQTTKTYRLHGGILLQTLSKTFPLLLLLGLLAFGNAHSEALCTYSTYQWNVREKRAVNPRKIIKPVSELSAAETDRETGCTVCEEDQVTLEFAGLRPFRICKLIAPRVQASITSLLLRKQPIVDVVGYRVGITRGESDSAGNRSGFSNHSFGVALDINTQQNGLYENCINFNGSCRLLKGGVWNPQHELSLTADSEIVREFKRIGFRWGGEIAGRQKDFMHFSPTGY